jgi:hypothetical protein
MAPKFRFSVSGSQNVLEVYDGHSVPRDIVGILPSLSHPLTL